MNITEINKQVCKMLRDEINPIIQNKLKEYGLEGGLGNARYDDSTVTFKFEARLEGSPTKRDKDLQINLDRWAFQKAIQCGVEKEDILNKEYRIGANRYRLTGYNTKASKRPIYMENIMDKREYAFSIEDIDTILPVQKEGIEYEAV